MLRSYQAAAVWAAIEALEGRGSHELLRNRRGLILADDVGMGKTWEALAAAVLIRAKRRGNIYLLVPPGLRKKWLDEIQVFCAKVRARPASGRVHRAAARLQEDAERVVISTHDARRFVRRRSTRRASLVVVDEAHKARNSRSVLFRALKKLVTRNRRCGLLLLTATPFQCDYHRELINLLSLVDGAYVGPEVPESNRGFTSIAAAVEYGLNQMRAHLRALVQQGEDPLRTLEQLQTELDRNLDREQDPKERTFGVALGHDGFDEYLRALVVRTIKDQPKETPHRVVAPPDDTGLYLLGRNYLRAHRLAGPAGFDVLGDPPPGRGFLPNGYSRLCSTYAAQQPRRRRGLDCHGKILASRASSERQPQSALGHPKLAALSERIKAIDFKASPRNKVVVFANHVATVSQLRTSLAKVDPLSRMSARVAREKPRVGDLAATSQLMAGTGWPRLKRALGEWLDPEEIESLRAAVARHLALIRSEDRRQHWAYLRDSIAAVNGEVDGASSKGKRRLRGELTGDTSRRSSITRGLRVRTFRPVEALWGETDMLRRHRLIRAFNAPGVPPFVLVVSQAGSEGQNMHKACRSVIHFDLHWNPTVIHQRTGRVYRDTVKARSVSAVELIYSGAYDETIKAYARRRDAFRDFLLGERTLEAFLRAQDINHEVGGSWRIDLAPDKVTMG